MSRQFVPTGIKGLDEILYGGFLKDNFILVEGRPGTGKSTLALEFLYRGAVQFNEPGVFLTFETSREKILRDARGFGWDFEALEAQGKLQLISTTPAAFFAEFKSPQNLLSQAIEKIKAKRFVLDGLSPFRFFGEKAGLSYRESLQALLAEMERSEVTALVTTEAVMSSAIGETGLAPEHFLADTVLTLKNEIRNSSLYRSLEVSKSRGQNFKSGLHTVKIFENEGLQVFPRISCCSTEQLDAKTSTHKSAVGILGANEMFGGGVYDGSITLVVGISGTGKTVAGMQFLDEGVKMGKKGLIVTLDEHPRQLCRNAHSLSLPFKENVESDKIRIYYTSPLEIRFDEHFYQIKDLIEKEGIERVVIDSVVAYEQANRREAHDFLYALASYFKSHLITAFFNYECPELLGVSQISDELKASALADNIMLLNYVEISTHLRRAITIPKTRGSRSDKLTREYVIQEGGIAVLEDKTADVQLVPQLPLSSYYGVLARSPTRHSPVIDEHVAAGKPMPKTKLPKPSPKTRKKIQAAKSKRAH